MPNRLENLNVQERSDALHKFLSLIIIKINSHISSKPNYHAIANPNLKNNHPKYNNNKNQHC